MMLPSTVRNFQRRSKTPILFEILEISRFILLLLLFPAALISGSRVRIGPKNPAGKSPPLIQIRLAKRRFEKSRLLVKHNRD